jgi:hypothetical protein
MFVYFSVLMHVGVLMHLCVLLSLCVYIWWNIYTHIQQVGISGANFGASSSPTRVTFGSYITRSTWASSSTIFAVAPPGVGRDLPVTVSVAFQVCNHVIYIYIYIYIHMYVHVCMYACMYV